ncbi:hypothetical protein D477_002658 [Arthrobacter crystallopoietes BAB-32]|uniref:Uncharacterized protein n=1 Tax=Arthrobacter crystallopoietes BAB-32 TaxID=1246476 RepID=N1VBV2_9MICC|nr:hypothetical protein [Arthrobacter crystallopoietes]EMY35758.1 hypothetical protein D477_002658 [Arthrobacter crystallopoietes BAB-32]
MRNYTPVEVIDALENDQELYLLKNSPNGRDALRETVAHLTQDIESESNRQAEAANEFHDELAPEVAQLEEFEGRVQELITALHNTSGSQLELQDAYFALEEQSKVLISRVLNKEARIEGILANLHDPVGSLSRLQSKFPILRRPYLEPFGK